MSTKIITGYTGERSITSSDDAQIYQALGISTGILPVEDEFSVSMPSINQLVVGSGFLAIQGHIGRFTQEAFAIDTCASGSHRIDRCIARYQKNASTSIESLTLMVLKGAETTSTAEAPDIYSGSIEDGAAIVDLLLYEIALDGSSVSIKSGAPIARTGPVIKLSDVSISSSACVSDSTYSGYPYHLDIEVGCTSDYVPTVIPKPEDAGNFYSLAETGDGYIRLFCVNNAFGNLTIPTVILVREG